MARGRPRLHRDRHAVAEPCRDVDGGAEEDVVVQVEVALGQPRNVVDVRLDVAGVEDRQCRGGQQVAVVDDRDAGRRLEPLGHLRIRHDPDMAVIREEAFQGPQVVARLTVVATAIGDVAVDSELRWMPSLLGGECTRALPEPAGVGPVDPKVHHVDRRMLAGRIWS
jgi:hypothetical protein